MGKNKFTIMEVARKTSKHFTVKTSFIIKFFSMPQKKIINFTFLKCSKIKLNYIQY